MYTYMEWLDVHVYGRLDEYVIWEVRSDTYMEI